MLPHRKTGEVPDVTGGSAHTTHYDGRCSAGCQTMLNPSRPRHLWKRIWPMHRAQPCGTLGTVSPEGWCASPALEVRIPQPLDLAPDAVEQQGRLELLVAPPVPQQVVVPLVVSPSVILPHRPACSNTHYKAGIHTQALHDSEPEHRLSCDSP